MSRPIDILRFEIKRLPHKRNILLFLILCLLLTVFIQTGTIEYKLSLKNKEIFQNSEKTKVNQYVLYNQYGGFGLRLFFLPSAISILFSGSSDSLLLASVNAAEKLNIFKPYKGKYVFESPGYMFSTGILYIFGCLFALLFGFTAKKNFLKFHSHFLGYSKAFTSFVISRLIVIYLVFCLLNMFSYFLIFINGVNIELEFFFFWFIFGSLVFTIFFLSGLFISAFKDKTSKIIILGSVYFLFVFLLPWMVDKISHFDASGIESYFNFELTNIKLYNKIERRLIKQFGPYRKLADDEKQVFMKKVTEALNNEFRKIFEREKRMKLEILKRIKFNQILSSIFPTTFLLSINRETSSTGYLNLIDFYDFAFERKKGFLEFYTLKSFVAQNKPGNIENFIQKDENIYQAKSRFPYGFGLGVGLTALYIIGTFFIGYRLHFKNLKRKIKGIDIDVDFKGKSTAFVLCKNETIKEGIFNHYKNQDTACFEKINPDDFRMNGIKPADLLEHLSRVARVDDKAAVENLNIMGVDIDTAENSHETILKIYAAVMAATDQQLIVINDFLKRESRQFETEVFRLLSHLEKAGKRIIYLSMEMYQPANGFDEQIRIDKYGVFPIVLDGLTLR